MGIPGADRPSPDGMTDMQIKRELDRLQHTGYTCDHKGTEQSKKNGKREARLRDAYTGEYEHDEATCNECQLMDQITRGMFDGTD